MIVACSTLEWSGVGSVELVVLTRGHRNSVRQNICNSYLVCTIGAVVNHLKGVRKSPSDTDWVGIVRVCKDQIGVLCGYGELY